MTPKQELEAQIHNHMGEFIYQNTGQIERILSIPIYEDDDYSSILKRFIMEFGDDGILDLILKTKYEKK